MVGDIQMFFMVGHMGRVCVIEKGEVEMVLHNWSKTGGPVHHDKVIVTS